MRLGAATVVRLKSSFGHLFLEISIIQQLGTEQGIRNRALTFDGFLDGVGELLLGHFGADEKLLTRAVGKADRFPAILRRDGDADFDRALRVTNRSDYTGNYGTDVVAGDQPVEHRPQAFENAVLDLQLSFARAESEWH